MNRVLHQDNKPPLPIERETADYKEGAVGGQIEGPRLHEIQAKEDFAGLPVMNPEVRRRVPTERGAEYTTDIRRRNLKRCITKWRRVVGETWDIMADTEDAKTLKDKREEIKLVFADVEEASRNFLEVSAIDEIPIDSLQRETSDLRKVLDERIMELKDQDARSRRSHRTRATSRRSIRSVRSLKLEEEAKAAELEVKLKYHQIEAAAAK